LTGLRLASRISLFSLPDGLISTSRTEYAARMSVLHESSGSRGCEVGPIPIRPVSEWFLGVAPYAIMVFIWALLFIPATRPVMMHHFSENRAVEIATLFFFVAGGLYGLWMTRALWRSGRPRWIVWFYGVFAVGLLFLAGEEIAWGQWIFKWETPERWMAINIQEETTLHNVWPLQGNTEFLRLGFGVAALIGVALGRIPALRPLAPSRLLLPWFWAILLFGFPDLYNDYHRFEGWLQPAINKSSEAIEMLISMSSFLYVGLQSIALLPRTPFRTPL
jgi:hypothetical protein